MDAPSAAATALELVAVAQPLLGKIVLSRPGLQAGTVASALRSVTGAVYTGVCMHLTCGIGFCAEHASVAEMLKGRETQIAMIVAVCDEGVLPPCGRCRELLVQVDPRNLDSLVVLPGMRIVPLRELLPHHWYDVGK